MAVRAPAPVISQPSQEEEGSASSSLAPDQAGWGFWLLIRQDGDFGGCQVKVSPPPRSRPEVPGRAALCCS